jgi:hypothetical protein
MQDLTLGYSARVDLKLLVNGRLLDVAQVGPDRCVLRNPVELPQGTEGEIIMHVDNHERRWHVLLFEGANSDTPIVHFKDI